MLMIMNSNSKKCSTMRKFITTMLIAAAAFTACVQNDEVVVPNNNDKITFTATVTAPETRTVLVQDDADTYHAEWQNNDVIEVFEITDVKQSGDNKYQSNVTKVVVDGTNSTANVELNVFDTATSYYYVLTTTNASMNKGGNYVGLTLPAAQAPAAMNTFDGASDMIVSKRVQRTSQPAAGETISFDNIRISAIVKVTIKNLALAAGDKVESVTFSCNKEIAGKFTKIYLDEIENGTPFAKSSGDGTYGDVTVTLPEAQSGDFSYYMNVWPATLEAGEEYSVVVTTKNDSYIKTGTISADKPLSFTMGEITTLTVNMSGVVAESVKNPAVEMPAYIEVADIKWATGNLEYEVDGTTDDGFITDWCIAPSQEHHFNMNTTGTANLTNYNKVAHFNFGGIPFGEEINPFSTSSNSALHIAGPTGEDSAFDFSGKIFTDAACTEPATGWADAKYGDIAYWASKGQYRMPTSAEFASLFSKCCYQLVKYNDILGLYFWDPKDDGENPGLVVATETKDLSDTEITTGLFLPCTGRAYNNTEYKIYKVDNQAIYRTSTVASHSTSDSTDKGGYGVLYRIVYDGVIPADTVADAFLDNGVRSSGTNKGLYNHGSTARYAIRPVYNK